MRLFEVYQPLLESQTKIEKLAEKYGNELIKSVNTDATAYNVTFPTMSSDIEDWMHEFIDDEYDGAIAYVDINSDHFDKKGFSEALVQFFADNFDPTPNNKYLDWILRMYNDYHNVNFFIEDSELVQDILNTFHQFKKHLPVKDINQYKTFSELKKAIKPFESDISDTLKQKVLGTGEAEILFEADDEKLVHVKTLKASKAFARGTEWCTQYPNMFNRYDEQGPIYIIDTPNPDDRIQIHFESEQVMDIDDNEVDPFKLMDTSPTYQWLIKQKIEEIESSVSTRMKITRSKNMFFFGMPFKRFLRILKGITTPSDLDLGLRVLYYLKANSDSKGGISIEEYHHGLDILSQISDDIEETRTTN